MHTSWPLVESTGFELMDMVGRAVLPLRHHRELLADPQMRRAWAKEKSPSQACRTLSRALPTSKSLAAKPHKGPLPDLRGRLVVAGGEQKRPLGRSFRDWLR